VPPTPPMRTMTTQWTKSSVDRKAFNELRLKVVISEAANVIRLRVPSRTEVEPRPEEHEVISFTHFHSFGFGVLAYPLLRWLLYYYRLCLHDLTPQGILHLSIFIIRCEGSLGVLVHYELWWSLFRVVCSVPGSPSS
jgi:hypothetical protein